MPYNRLIFRVHAIRRMFQRQISVLDIQIVLTSGEIIEAYPDDIPYASYLMLGWCGTRPVHIVAADDTAAGETIIITVYEPDLTNWEDGFKRRKL
jgi:hypothetical protein